MWSESFFSYHVQLDTPNKSKKILLWKIQCILQDSNLCPSVPKIDVITRWCYTLSQHPKGSTNLLFKLEQSSSSLGIFLNRPNISIASLSKSSKETLYPKCRNDMTKKSFMIGKPKFFGFVFCSWGYRIEIDSIKERTSKHVAPLNKILEIRGC